MQMIVCLLHISSCSVYGKLQREKTLNSLLHLNMLSHIISANIFKFQLSLVRALVPSLI